MGQKVNPIGIRLGISRKHNSTWYAEKDKYQELLLNDFAVREFLRKEAGYELLNNVKDVLSEISIVDKEPNMQGRRLSLILSPK